jgi:hypothetical protein
VKKGTTGHAQECVDAPPEVVYDLVADVTQDAGVEPRICRL